MSASEKLKALDEAMRSTPHGERTYENWIALRSALPQIRAVVEAAEAAEDALRIHGRGPELIVGRHALQHSLTALDEALQ